MGVDDIGTGLGDFANTADRLEKALQESATAKRGAAAAKADAIKLRDEVRRLEQLLHRFTQIHEVDTVVPTWLATTAEGPQHHHATAVFMLSDLHLDEKVDFYEMDGINEYSREIAERRLHQVIEGVIKLLKTYVSGVELDGLLCALLGDIITGIIHFELAMTNEAPVPASIASWVPVLCSALVYLADELDIPIHVCPVDGNHDRTMQKTPMKQRATSSYACIIYNWMADHLRDDDRITFGITVAAEQLVDVYTTTLLLSHGDSFRSQGGVGGLYPSMLKWLHRRHEQYGDTRRDFDYALIGHWHQSLFGQDFFVNGSLKGYDEYAKQGGFKYERPQQTLFLITPERGVVQRMTVHAD